MSSAKLSVDEAHCKAKYCQTTHSVEAIVFFCLNITPGPPTLWRPFRNQGFATAHTIGMYREVLFLERRREGGWVVRKVGCIVTRSVMREAFTNVSVRKERLCPR